jgi:hypothetical protein
LRWYGANTRTWEHRDRALFAGHAAALRWEAMTPQERWDQATPAEVLDMSLHAERGPMVLDDLRALPRSPLVVAEGSTLPAQAVSSGIAGRSRAVWLLPTDDFQRALLEARGVPPGPTALYLLLQDLIAREASGISRAAHDLPPGLRRARFPRILRSPSRSGQPGGGQYSYVAKRGRARLRRA